jgi:hypothetical protein
MCGKNEKEPESPPFWKENSNISKGFSAGQVEMSLNPFFLFSQWRKNTAASGKE